MEYLSQKKLENYRNLKIIPFLNGDILELGCGRGFIPQFLEKNKKNNQYTGIDFNNGNIERLTNLFPRYNFIKHDLDEFIILENTYFDTIVSTAVIEHIYNQKNFFLTATKYLKKNGKIVITSPSIFGNDIIYPILCKIGIRGGKGELSDHITIYNKERFSVLAKDFGLEIEHFEHFEFFCNQLVVFRKK